MFMRAQGLECVLLKKDAVERFEAGVQVVEHDLRCHVQTYRHVEFGNWPAFSYDAASSERTVYALS